MALPTRPLARVLVLALGLAAFAHPGSVEAFQATGTGGATSPGAGSRAFNIRGGDLAEALRQLSRQSGVAVVADAGLVRGRRSPAVRMRATPLRAVQALIEGSDLQARVIGDTLVLARAPDVRPASPPLAAAPSPAPIEPVQVEDVVVTGRQGAALTAQEIKWRNLEISDVVSADDMGDLPVSNIAESLARLPGVNVVRNHQTGEGDRITVRGMSTEWNAYRINGVRLGGAGSRADLFYRGVRLSYLPADGVENLTVRKTLTPDMDGDALGGLIDIRTPTAFDEADDFVRLTVEEGVLTRFDQPSNHKAGLSISHRLSDRLGLFLSANWSDARSRFEMVGGDSDDLPPVWYADVYSTGWDLETFVKRGMELAVGETRVRRTGLNGSLDWRELDREFHLRFQHNAYRGEEYRNRLNFRNDALAGSERLSQADKTLTGLGQPDDRVIGRDPLLGRIYDYSLSEIRDEDGDGRITDADRKVRSLYSLDGASGVLDPTAFRLRRFWEGVREGGQLSSLTAGGFERRGRWTLSYDASVSRSRDDLDDDYTLEFRTNAVDWHGNRAIEIVETDDPRFPLWNLNPEGMAAVQDPAAYNFRRLSSETERVSEVLGQLQFDLTYRPAGSWMEAVQAGGRYMRSDRRRRGAARPGLSGPETLADLQPLFGRPTEILFDGRYSGDHRLGVTLDSERMRAEIARALAGEGQVFAIDPEAISSVTFDNFNLTEQALAGYLMATAAWGENHLTAGVRFEHTRTRMMFRVIDPLRGDGVDHRDNAFGNLLPSIHYRRRLGENAILRAAVWTSFARPDITRATTARKYVYDQDADDDGKADPKSDWVLIEVRQGTPDLLPMEAVGYDVSYEVYGRSTVWSLALYRKDIENFLYRASTSGIRDGGLGDAGTAEGVPVLQYMNGRWARVIGAEATFRHVFDWAPAPFDGLGFTASLTLQRSRAATNISWRPDDARLPLMETPDMLAVAELYWQGGGWEATLGWNHQSPFLEGMDSFGNDPYENSYNFIDLGLHRRFGAGNQISLQVRNLTNSHTYWYTFGSGSDNLREYIRTGPVVSLSARASF